MEQKTPNLVSTPELPIAPVYEWGLPYGQDGDQRLMRNDVPVAVVWLSSPPVPVVEGKPWMFECSFGKHVSQCCVTQYLAKAAAEAVVRAYFGDEVK